MKVFVIDFSSSNSIGERLQDKVQLFIEKLDGAHAYKMVGEIMPDLILVNYKTKPSHGRQTANSIRARKKTSHIPILFINVESNETEKIEQYGQTITMNDLDKYITSDKYTSL
jgi:response regulator RpfG family c-di-GMP phosphodiesterase